MAASESKGLVQYDDAFPQLPVSSLPNKNIKNMAKASLPASLRNQVVREMIEIPNTERRVNEKAFGNKNIDDNKIISNIAKSCGVEIDISSSRNQALTVILTGPPSKIADAKRQVVKEMQTQSVLRVDIPSQYHRFIVGKRGEMLKNLERETTTRVNIPPTSQSNNGEITIVGPIKGCEMAKARILKIVDEQSKLGSERLMIPKMYHTFIRGPRGSNLNKWIQNHKVKIDMPPPPVPAQDICVSGPRDGVSVVVKEIKSIHEKMADKCQSMPIKIPRSQHRLIVGPQGSGIAEILEKTGVSIEMPIDEASEELTLRGEPTDFGRALTMVYEKAASSERVELSAPNRFHKVLIGRKGAALSELLGDSSSRVRVDFSDNSDKIVLEGPSEDVSEIKTRLNARIKELEATMALKVLKVDTKYNRFIVGKDGANIRRIKDQMNVQVNIRENSINKMSEIHLEGDPKGIEAAATEIMNMENEKIKDVVIEPQLQQILRTPVNGVPPVRSIYDEYPQVSFHWPDGYRRMNNTSQTQETSSSICQLQGDKQFVDACYDKLIKLIRQVKESNHHVEFRLFKEFRPFVLGSSASEVRKILSDLDCRVQVAPPEASPISNSNENDFTLVYIIGREKQANEALDKIEALQIKQANIKEARVQIPSLLFAKVVGDKALRIRSIREQCSGVTFKFPRASGGKIDTNSSEIILSGPKDDLEKAKTLIQNLNDKVAELCEEVVVNCDKKYHGFLIGRAGQNLINFREKHGVELLFPDKNETDSKLANEIRIVGTKTTTVDAKKELERLIKGFEDEIEELVPVPQKYMRTVNMTKKTNQAMSRIRILPVRNSGANAEVSLEEENVESQETVMLRLVGSKAMVDDAKAALETLLDDMRLAITKSFPVNDKSHVRVLNRLRSAFRDWEMDYHLTIKLNVLSREEIDAMPDNADEDEYGSLVINGREEKINSVYQDKILPSLPITQKMEFPKEYHYNLIANPQALNNNRQKSKQENDDASVNKITDIQQKTGVFIKLPPMVQTEANFVTLNGTPSQVEDAKAMLTAVLESLDADKKDRLARSFEADYEALEWHVVAILEQKDKFRQDHDVVIRLKEQSNKNDVNDVKAENGHDVEEPKEEEEIAEASDSEPNEKKNEIPADAPHLLLSVQPVKLVLRGYESKVIDLKSVLDKFISETLSGYVRECLNVPQAVHSQLIGYRRSAQLRMQQEHNVMIEFPDRDYRGDSASIVVVMGTQENVDAACDQLIGKANELMERIMERDGHLPRNGEMNGQKDNREKRGPNNRKSNAKSDFVVHGAPWNSKGKSDANVPNTGSHSDFPTMNGSS